MPVVSRTSAFLLASLGMAFALLLTIAMLERSVVMLLFDASAPVAGTDIRDTFSALKLIVGVLPYTLGVLILVSFLLAIRQVFRDRSLLPAMVLLCLFGPMFYNIVLADTAAVVANLETTSPSDDIAAVTKSLMDAVRQHYIGALGFALAFLFRAILVLGRR